MTRALLLLATVAWRWAAVIGRELWVFARARWHALAPDAQRLLLQRSAFALLAAGLVIFLWSHREVPGHWWAATSGQRPLYAAKSWYFHIGTTSFERIQKSTADLVVMDYSKGDDGDPFTNEEIEQLRKRADGRRRLLVSYFSIGEAESYRFYWKKDWEQGDPGWLMEENCAWPRNFKIQFWHDGWKDAIYRGKRSYLKRIVDAGFDGVYLDRIDIYHNFEKERPQGRDEMIAFVAELARTARALKPGFIVIAQNADELLPEQRYRDVIDGLGREDLLYGVNGTNKRNPAGEIAIARRNLRYLLGDWKPVFAVEYLSVPALIESARRELEGLAIVPTFAHRSLDGLDPTAPRTEKTMRYGTPEWVAQHCKDKPHW